MKQRKMIEIDSSLKKEENTTSILPILAIFIILNAILIIFGLVELYSVTFPTSQTSYFGKQLKWIFIGTVPFTAIILIGAKKMSDWAPLILCCIIVGLIAALCCPPINGARRWIHFNFTSFSIQPSEFAKVGITLFLARYLSKRSGINGKRDFFKLIPGGAFIGCVIFLVLIGDDLGTTILLCTICVSMLYVAGIKLWVIVPSLLAVGSAGFFYIKHHDAMRWKRLTVFLDPEQLADSSGYQQWKSLLALGSGDWFGQGFGSSILKMKYLPEAHTDFILAIVGEELGFVALLTVLAIYLIFTFLGVTIATKARTRQNKYIAFGMTTFIAIQAVINVGVICCAFPTKGMPAPFISYGGSTMLSCMMASACIISVALDSAYPDYAKELWQKIANRILNSGFIRKWQRKQSKKAKLSL